MIAAGCQTRITRTDVTHTAHKSFTETVPGSTVTFVMRPVTTRDDAKPPRVIWFAETETTWNAYDVFYLRLDEHASGPELADAGREGPDAITRPTLPYEPPDRGWGHSTYPAMGITYHAAVKYCEWLSERTGRRYRLPTVAEWCDAAWMSSEKASSASKPTTELQREAWLADNSGQRTHPVAALAPNPLGLYDLVGNVAEWCSPGGSADAGERAKPVTLGGSFATDLAKLDVDARARVLRRGQPQARDWNANDPAFPKSKWWLRDAPFVGFRVVCEEGPP